MFSGSILRAFGLMIIAFFGIALATPVFAQTISATSNSGNIGSAVFVSQSFTATVTGTVTQIRVVSEADTATTVRFYNGAGTGQLNGGASPLYSQAVNLIDSRPSFRTIILGTPLPVTAGNVYSSAFDLASLRGGADSYAGGNRFFNGTQQDNGIDLTFEVVQVAGPVPVPVPTLSEWAMILFGLMLAGGAALYIQRRQLAA